MPLWLHWISSASRRGWPSSSSRPRPPGCLITIALGLAGAFLLADRLAHEPAIERATAGFERLWRPVVEDKQRNARSMARWFLPSSPADLRVRRLMLRLSRVPLVMGYVSSVLAGRDTRLADVMSHSPA